MSRSRENRSARLWARLGCGSLSATGRFNCPSTRTARHTMPMPPRPSSCSITYGPMTVPAFVSAGWPSSTSAVRPSAGISSRKSPVAICACESSSARSAPPSGATSGGNVASQRSRAAGSRSSASSRRRDSAGQCSGAICIRHLGKRVGQRPIRSTQDENCAASRTSDLVGNHPLNSWCSSARAFSHSRRTVRSLICSASAISVLSRPEK